MELKEMLCNHHLAYSKYSINTYWRWMKPQKTSKHSTELWTKIMASSPNTSWQIEGGKVETVTYFIFLDSKITMDGDCTIKLKRHLLLGRQAMTNLARISKSRDTTLLTKVHQVKVMVFPVVMYVWELCMDVRVGP